MNILNFFRKKTTQNGSEHDISTLNIEEQDMIRGIVELSKTSVKEVMIPRIDVVFVEDSMERSELYEKVSECGHSRVPVFKDTIDNVTGVLYVKDLFRAIVKNEEINVTEIARKPYFVPDSKRIDSLLREFKRRRVHIAVAVDEYGGVSGIVCMEDIIEEIVGDIQDEFDNEEEDILEIGDRVFLCDARVNIEELNEKLSLHIPDEDYDTLGGFVFDLFGKIPARYEKVDYGRTAFVVHSMNGRKIRTIKVEIGEEPEREVTAE